jgi:hypothetical protein
VIITDSLSTVMVVGDDINLKNPKTLSLRKLRDEEREEFTLLWLPGHMIIPANVIANEEATAALQDDL